MPLKSGPILLPLDGSDVAEGAVPYAVALSEKLGRPLVLLSVLEGDEAGLANTLPDVWLDLSRGAQEHFEKYLDKIRTQTGVNADVIVRTGNPSEQIQAAADEVGASVIVIATHGRSGIGRWLYGSTASRLLRSSKTPVMAVGPNALAAKRSKVEIKHIMVPLDGSELSEAALPLAVELASKAGGELSLVRAVQWAVQSYPYTLPDAYVPQLDDELEKGAKEYLRKREADAAKTAKVAAFVVRGPVADGLMDFAEQKKVDLIVMTTNARGGIARAALGSVADRLLQASTPVLLLRPDEG
jgi:nucleotide-binding universal stress UspA family protein